MTTLRQLRAADGEAIDFQDFGLVVVFRQPSQAIACAFDLRGRLNYIGLNVRAAVHIGVHNVSSGTSRLARFIVHDDTGLCHAASSG